MTVLHPTRTANPQGKRPKVKDRVLDAMIAAAWEAGWWCERTGSSHVMCYPADQKEKPVLVANTPSDHRTIPNTRSRLRRSGLAI